MPNPSPQQVLAVLERHENCLADVHSFLGLLRKEVPETAFAAYKNIVGEDAETLRAPETAASLRKLEQISAGDDSAAIVSKGLEIFRMMSRAHQKVLPTLRSADEGDEGKQYSKARGHISGLDSFIRELSRLAGRVGAVPAGSNSKIGTFMANNRSESDGNMQEGSVHGDNTVGPDGKLVSAPEDGYFNPHGEDGLLPERTVKQFRRGPVRSRGDTSPGGSINPLSK